MRAVWRWLPLALVLSASSISRSVTAGQSPEPFELNELTIAQVQAALTEGRYTSRQITELYLKRIESIDRSGPGLHSVSETNPEALSIADALDAERKARGPRGPLHGVPILIKDNIDTADRMTTTAGSLALEGSIAARDAHSLADVIAFNEREHAREMPYFGQELFIAAQKKGPLTTAVYREAVATCRTRSRALGIDAVLKRLRLDALVAPTGGPAWTTDLVNGDHFGGASSTPAAVAGYPSITVPAGEVYGLPVGLSFIGPAWSERRLIGLAYAFEQATKHRRPPRFLPVTPR